MTYKPSMVRSSEDEVVTVKLLAELALPPAVVTEILPVVAPLGTVVEICVALFTVNEAACPLNATAVAPLRFVPVMVTPAPMSPLLGLKLVMAGAGTVTVKLAAELAFPLGVVTEILPVVALLGTVAAICVALVTAKAAAIPLKLTAVAPIRLVPVMVTGVATGPLPG